MLDQLQKVRDLQNDAKTHRKRGDAFRRIEREDEAINAYRAGLAALSDTVEILRPAKAELAAPNPRLTTELEELIETLGARGGMLERLGRLEDAAESYEEGALLEERFALPSTYNRLNAVKYSLLCGTGRLRDFETKLRELADHLDKNLRADKSFSDSGWAWADLGDCLALLGESEKAREAYSSFVSKAEIKSPERTLDVLRQIASSLEKSADPDASRLKAAIDMLESSFKT